ncbi:hypothetical protein A3I25_00670 [Candidatus Nomurabacteria bacterium RIFCSPLOWO2_02_FULL_42_17]|uniref:Uncharacterized protein n=1 Tax=Candidatus Nomurabacteria bacterium RIFCSPLOWO2_02_FULL_42_17 TaxID=1801789 RepID=A0A1F6XPZ0_9BACT|nr:MAG: RND family efflux transporter MFP subunit [Parcubacteria group bacterium GW2011_GWA2_42_18]OGI96141.1 MAG: hypothetical protein A3I25_00670 [Candidatus Nomurabacteria bacterium RIFCSPLOWO2_02_FULL_42_17]
MIKILRKKSFIISAIIIVLIIASFFILRGDKTPEYDSVIAEKGTITEEVSVTGRVKPAQSVNLAPEQTGQVSDVSVAVGDKVWLGKTLIQLRNDELLAQLLQAEANLASEEAKLSEIKKGTRPEEVQVQEVRVKNTQSAINDAKKNLIDKLQDAYTKSDDAIRNKVDQFFNNPRGSNPTLVFFIIDSQLDNDIKWGRLLVEVTLENWKLSLGRLIISSDLSSYTNEAEKNLEQIKSFLDKASLAINSTYSTTTLSQTTTNSWKSDVSTARTNIYTAISNLTTAEEKLKTAESDSALSEQELVLKRAEATPEQILSQEAKVKSTQADVQNMQAKIAKTIIRSPINGIVTIQNAKVGEIVANNTSIISIISEADFEIEANIPEADIAKVKISNTAQVTLDAYGDDVIFEAKIIAIDPAETIIEGVSTYKTTLQFLKEDNRIKSGMTANIDILNNKKDNVVFIPIRAVEEKDGRKVVKILNNGEIREVGVETGLRGSDGNIEVITGINEGDEVIVLIKE